MYSVPCTMPCLGSVWRESFPVWSVSMQNRLRTTKRRRRYNVYLWQRFLFYYLPLFYQHSGRQDIPKRLICLSVDLFNRCFLTMCLIDKSKHPKTQETCNFLRGIFHFYILSDFIGMISNCLQYNSVNCRCKIRVFLWAAILVICKTVIIHSQIPV